MWSYAIIPVLMMLMSWGAYERGRQDQAATYSRVVAQVNGEIGILNATTAASDTAAAVERDRLAQAALQALAEDVTRADAQAESASHDGSSVASIPTATARLDLPTMFDPARSAALPPGQPAMRQSMKQPIRSVAQPPSSPLYTFSEHDIARFNAIK